MKEIFKIASGVLLGMIIANLINMFVPSVGRFIK